MDDETGRDSRHNTQTVTRDTVQNGTGVGVESTGLKDMRLDDTTRHHLR